jgi:serpin B
MLGLRPPPTGSESFAKDNNDFAIALYKLVKQQRRNLFLSPFSVRTILAMVEAGARGLTSTQIRETLRISSSSETHHVASAKLIQRFNDAAAGHSRMVVANSLWA